MVEDSSSLYLAVKGSNVVKIHESLKEYKLIHILSRRSFYLICGFQIPPTRYSLLPPLGFDFRSGKKMILL